MPDAKSLCRTALLGLVASTVLLVAAVPGARADQCKQAGPLPQSKCTKDSQCCPGLVCQTAGPSKNNATMQCMPGCRIGGAFQTPAQKNTAPNNCQSCQPSVSTTAWTNVASGTTCRPSAGVCDVAETCNGTSGACPANGFASSTTVCRASAGTCDVAENCTGTNATCPADAKSTAVCRSAQGDCDVAESCDGTSNACPGDSFASSTVVCRQSMGDCDVAENCTGTSAACPPDASQPDGTLCDDGGTCAAGVCETTTTTTISSTTTTTGCTPRSCANFDCGTVEDGCGGTVDCPCVECILTCPDGSMHTPPAIACGAGGVSSSTCASACPQICVGFCSGGEDCTSQECDSCGSSTTTTTVPATTTTTTMCTPAACTDTDFGPTPDGCGGTLTCCGSLFCPSGTTTLCECLCGDGAVPTDTPSCEFSAAQCDASCTGSCATACGAQGHPTGTGTCNQCSPGPG